MQFTTTTHVWESSLRSAMLALNYNAVATSAAVAWVEHRGRFDRCPIIDRADVAPLNQLVVDALQRQADRQAELEVVGYVEQDPERWPSWTDGHRWEPSLEDRAEWAATCDAIERAPEAAVDLAEVAERN